MGRPRCPGSVQWVANPGTCMDGEGLPVLLKRCQMYGSHLLSPSHMAILMDSPGTSVGVHVC